MRRRAGDADHLPCGDPAGSACCDVVRAAAKDAWGRLISPSLEREIRSELTDKANEGAIRVFGDNLHQLLMQPPIRGKVTLGVDPGFRTGCKLAVVDETAGFGDGVGYFTLPNHEAQKPRAKAQILGMIRRHKVTAVAIGNGTASRESEQFIASLLPEARAWLTSSSARRARASTRLPNWRRRNFRNTTFRSEARFPSRGACRTRLPNW